MELFLLKLFITILFSQAWYDSYTNERAVKCDIIFNNYCNLLSRADAREVWQYDNYSFLQIWAMTSQNNKISVRPAKTQISLGIRPVWSESSLSA